MASNDVLAVFLPQHNEPPVSNPATLDLRNNHPVLDFDATTQESAIFRGVMPSFYSDGDIRVYLIWAATSAISGTGAWDAAFETILSSSHDIDADGFAAARTLAAATVPGTAGQTITGSIDFTKAQADGVDFPDVFRLRIRRDVANDNASGDLELLAVVMIEL